MALPIEDYGFIGNMVTAALVGRDGSIDWLCLPSFNAPACFAALLGTPEHGRWLIAPASSVRRTRRAYRPGTLVLETSFETKEGQATVIDFMPLTDDDRKSEVVRIVRGDKGRVPMRMELVLRFGYGRTVPWVRRRDYGLTAVSGPDAVELHTSVGLRGENFRTLADFTVTEGETVPFTLAYHPSHLAPRFIPDRHESLEETAQWWRQWSERCVLPSHEKWREAVGRSLITLKALTFQPTGGIAAAVTTSLPEEVGGVRNWDYRYCWIRDAAFTLDALVSAGYRDEALAWRAWLLRAAAGHPAQLQIVYGLSGERWLPEVEVPWLPGYEGSRPVRIGNAAADQLQLDVYGELIDALHVARESGLEGSSDVWRIERTLLETLERRWREPDQGIWEMRGEPRPFTHSRLMCWVAFDRAVKAIERHGLDGPLERWRGTRDAIRKDICENGFSTAKNAFTQCYGSDNLDAALLLMPQEGFLTADDPRLSATIEAVERELVHEGLVRRYIPERTPDGLPGSEGTFIACTFWLADAYAHVGQREKAEAIFERCLSLRNDLGLLAEEYDPVAKRQLGNFPQALSHVALVNAAHALTALRTGERRAPGRPSLRAQAAE